MKKKNISARLIFKKATVADLEGNKISGGLAKDTLQRDCVSYPYRCSIQECVYTDRTCIHTETCQRPRE